MDPQPSAIRTRRRTISCVVLAVAPILGGALGYFLAFLFFSGWFAAWQTVASPPEKAVRILTIHDEGLWVQTASGAVYQNLNSRTCQKDCWQRVDAPPAVFTEDDSTLSVLPQSCKPVPPSLGAREVVSQCLKAYWWDTNIAYALRADGSLSNWFYTSGGEYEPLGIVMFIAIGAVAFFAVALIVALVTWSKKT
ncbi:MAG TPA: hypothetical protein VGJ97_11405 [Anaerolineaceae bacterium]